ncbi:MaoC family dehydratase [Lentzea aerocolonigenes]|uniref:MaoC family dehydratase n=1 Tax=Lentzea aerocolonigenes TaxID=68170 RepID=UPI0004C3E76A|nr:MaoC family dehydratase [Lentzea aerocolonigenes]MCP2244325.1 Acyl dehydratase [Lentzea aerocolonigenes]
MTTAVHGIEELKALTGKDLGHTDWLQIDQGRVNTFADATDDHQWIHVDAERAAEGPFGGTIAHGYLTLALLIPLMTQLLDISGVRMSINYGLDKVRFPAPVPVGAKIRLTGKVASVDEVKGDGVQITIDFTVEIEGSDKPACVARGVYRHYA